MRVIFFSKGNLLFLWEFSPTIRVFSFCNNFPLSRKNTGQWPSSLLEMSLLRGCFPYIFADEDQLLGFFVARTLDWTGLNFLYYISDQKIKDMLFYFCSALYFIQPSFSKYMPGDKTLQFSAGSGKFVIYIMFFLCVILIANIWTN